MHRPLAFRGRLLVLPLLFAAQGCFGIIHEPQRHFYVLALHTTPSADEPHIAGLLRVRDLDTETAYDRLQLVVRKSPFEVAYRPRDTWAVKPGRMLADLVARAFLEHNTFDGVTRELGERRPDYLLSGELHALEVEQSQSRWTARLALTLQLSHTETGDILWSGHYDERAPCGSNSYAAAVAAFSDAFARITMASLHSLKEHPHWQPKQRAP